MFRDGAEYYTQRYIFDLLVNFCLGIGELHDTWHICVDLAEVHIDV